MAPVIDQERRRDIAQQLCVAGERLYAMGMAYGTSGNISARLDERHILIKGTGSCMGYCGSDEYLVVGMDGSPVGADGRPSKETGFHLGIYNSRPEVGSVMHVHAMYATVLGFEGDELPLISLAGKAYLKRIPVLPEMKAGGADLAEAVKEAFLRVDGPAIALRGHGIVVVGKDIETAFNLTTLVEDSCRISYHSLLLKKQMQDK